MCGYVCVCVCVYVCVYQEVYKRTGDMWEQMLIFTIEGIDHGAVTACRLSVLTAWTPAGVSVHLCLCNCVCVYTYVRMHHIDTDIQT